MYSKAEINRIRVACKIVATALDSVVKIVEPGISTIILDKLARDVINKHDADPAFLGYKGYPGAICVSVNEEVVHGIPSKDRILKEGDIVSIDIGVKKDGYFGDAAITVPVGGISTDVKKLLNVTHESLLKAISKSIPDNRIGDISSSIQMIAEKNGYSVVRDFVGHGIGRNLHEELQVPNFGSEGTGTRIREGMVFAIEPMVNMGTYKVKVKEDGWTVVTLDKKLSCHFEHTIAIGGDEPRILTVLE